MRWLRTKRSQHLNLLEYQRRVAAFQQRHLHVFFHHARVLEVAPEDSIDSIGLGVQFK